MDSESLSFSYPQSSRRCRYDRSRFQLRSVRIQHRKTDCSLLTSRKPHDSKNSVMWHSPDDRQFAEIFVKCDKYPSLRKSSAKNFFVAGICIPVPDPNDVVAVCAERDLNVPPHASIQENLHDAVSTLKDSILSWPTNFRA